MKIAMKIKTQLLFLTIMLMIMISTSAQAQLFRWVDDQGVVHFSDRLPQKDSKRNYEKLGSDARTVEVVRAEKTQAELDSDYRQQQMQKELDRIAVEQRTKDATLLRTFGSTTDIDRILNSRVASIQNTINLMQSKIGKVMVKLKQSEKKRAGYVEREELVPLQLTENIREYRQQISSFQDKISDTRRMQDEIAEKFAADKQRFIQLKEKQTSLKEPLIKSN